jgi:hypothetical protein
MEEEQVKNYLEYNDFTLKIQSHMSHIVLFNRLTQENRTWGMGMLTHIKHYYYL